jgi:hypothetical protein
MGSNHPHGDNPAMNTDITHVWIVNRLDEVDPLYGFVDEDQAREYAARFGENVGAIITGEVVMNYSAGAQFLIDTYEPDDLDLDHPIIYRVKTEAPDGTPHDDYDAFESATKAFAQYAATAMGTDPDPADVRSGEQDDPRVRVTPGKCRRPCRGEHAKVLDGAEFERVSQGEHHRFVPRAGFSYYVEAEASWSFAGGAE